MIVVLNNKSNLNRFEYVEYIQKLSNENSNHEIILCPSMINISIGNHLKNIQIGAQNVSAYKNGAHTGEISATQLASYNVKYCLVGHSERRLEQHEKKEDFKDKINRLIEEDITPIYCIGETKYEKDNNMTKEIIQKELEIINSLTENILIAYEPVWAIGTGLCPTNEEIKEVASFIKTKLPNHKVLYGGSVNEENIKEISKIEQIDGYLIGGLSLHPEKIHKLLLNIEK